MTDRSSFRRRAASWVIVLAVVLVAGLAAVAARQITSSLRGDQPTRPAAVTTPDASGALPPPSLTPPQPGALAPGTGSEPIIGQPVIQEVDRAPQPDRVTLQPGLLPDFFSGQLPEAAPPEAAPSETTPPETGPSGLPPDRPDVTTGEAAPPPQPFGVGIRVTTGGHFATIIVGVSGGPDGLASLTVDFGDGSSYQLPEDEVGELREGGTVRVLHRYEPTLTPQPQRATVDAADGAGQSKQATSEFETRAEFVVRFSPLTVTALSECDLVGKGDFTLRWSFERSGRWQRSQFDLGNDESYVVSRFSHTVYGVHYRDTPEYELAINESDGIASVIPPIDLGDIDEGYADVIEIGTHSYPVTHFMAVDCTTRLDFTYSVILFD